MIKSISTWLAVQYDGRPADWFDPGSVVDILVGTVVFGLFLWGGDLVGQFLGGTTGF
jgi:hypothetical protein